MASFCRSAVMAGSRSIVNHSKTVARKTVTSTPLSPPLSSPTRAMFSAARATSALGSVESLMPLHSAIAAARLKSNIAVDSSCWSWLSQAYGFYIFFFFACNLFKNYERVRMFCC